jgi:hypothetical protein
MPKGIGQLLIDGLEFIPRVHREAGSPDVGNLFVFNAEPPAEQPGLVPRRQPDQLLTHGLDAAEDAEKSRQTQNEIDSLRKRRTGIDGSFPIPHKATGVGSPWQSELLQLLGKLHMAGLKWKWSKVFVTVKGDGFHTLLESPLFSANAKGFAVELVGVEQRFMLALKLYHVSAGRATANMVIYFKKE